MQITGIPAGARVRLKEDLPSVDQTVPAGAEGTVVHNIGLSAVGSGEAQLDALMGYPNQERLFVAFDLFPADTPDERAEDGTPIPAGWEAVYAGQVEVIALPINLNETAAQAA